MAKGAPSRPGTLTHRLVMFAFVAAIAVSCGGGGGGGTGGGMDTGPGAYVRDPEMPGRGVDLVVNDQDDLIFTAMDDENRHYSFFGVRGADGVAQRFDQLAIHQWLEGDVTEHYVTVDFDEHQRPTRVLQTVTGDGIRLRYLGADIDVTTFHWEGDIETVTVANPYGFELSPKPNSRDAAGQRVSIAVADQRANFNGVVKACGGPAMPQVLVRRPSLSSPHLPAAVWIPRVEAFPGPDPAGEGFTHRFAYHFCVPNQSYDEWRSACIRQKLRGAALTGVGIVDEQFGLTTTLHDLGTSIYEDVRDGSVSNTGRTIVGILIDKFGEENALGLPLSFYVNAVSEYFENEGHGPCSEHIWLFKRSVALEPQEVFCLYGESLKKVDFKPPPYAPSENISEGIVAEAAQFDFSQECCTEVPWRVRVSHEPKYPTESQLVTVTAQFIPPTAGCTLTFRVLFKNSAVLADYSEDRTTDANGRASIQVAGGPGLGVQPLRTAVQVDGGPRKEYVGSEVNSVWWDFR